jgi:hypothetical protein
MLAVALDFVMGALMLGAGIALLQRRANATRIAALACLVLVVGLQLTFPYMSIFSRLLGVGIPIALLLASRRDDSSAMPSMA